MKISHIYKIIILEPEYTDLFHCHIEFETVENWLRCDVTLVDNNDSDKSITIVTGFSEGYDMAKLHEDAIDLLNNKKYCMDIFG